MTRMSCFFTRAPRGWSWGAGLLLGGVFFQCLLGGLVAGAKAGMIYTDWPMMNGALFPPVEWGQGALTFLHDQGLVIRTPDPDDRRHSRVALTEAGREVLQRNRRRRDAWLAVRLAALTPEEREVLHRAVRILEKVTSA